MGAVRTGSWRVIREFQWLAEDEGERGEQREKGAERRARGKRDKKGEDELRQGAPAGEGGEAVGGGEAVKWRDMTPQAAMRLRRCGDERLEEKARWPGSRTGAEHGGRRGRNCSEEIRKSYEGLREGNQGKGQVVEERGMRESDRIPE